MSHKTKIIVTLGPATETQEMIGKLIDGGVNVMRLNMSHAKHEWAAEMTKLIRAESKKRNAYIAVLFDLTGPSIRTGDHETPYDLKEGDKVEFRSADVEASIPLSTTVNYPGLMSMSPKVTHWSLTTVRCSCASSGSRTTASSAMYVPRARWDPAGTSTSPASD